MRTRPARLSTLLLALAAPASAQLIQIRNLPVAQDHQFEIFPSQHLAMGGVSIALADTLLDPFRNPAAAVRLGSGRFFGTPAVYSVSRDAGGGRTLPLGVFGEAGPWHGGVWLAAQEVDGSQPNTFFPGPIPLLVGPRIIVQEPPRPAPSYANKYAVAALGRRLAGGWAAGASLYWAGLNGVDGVDLLYAGSQRVEQDGHALDLRLGVLKEWVGDRTAEAVLVHNRYTMTHDVSYLDPVWDPGTQRIVQRLRLEHHTDRTSVWGLHLEHERPLGDAGWRIGWLATANRMAHPKIPEYELVSVQAIPRDPGYSSAFNVGMGVSRRHGRATFGLDAVYEPVWSHTWADAATPVVTAAGDTIPPGGMTIENHFRFANSVVRLGFSQDIEVGASDQRAALQLGLVVRSVHYWLDQADHVQISRRSQEEAWVEWTPTWGLTVRFPALEIRYRGQVTNGTGRPGVGPTGGFIALEGARAAIGILAAPTGPLTLDEVKVVTHQVSLALPLR